MSVEVLGGIADVLVANLKPSSRIILFANNPAVPDEVFQTLDPQSDDVVVLFNIPIHRKWAAKAHRLIIFQNNHLGSAWGFDKNGSATPEAVEVLNGSVQPLAAVFSGKIPDVVLGEIPEAISAFGLASSNFIDFYPNRGVSKTPSIGFYGYMLIRKIKEAKKFSNPIYLVGFSGKSEKPGSIVSHDWIYEQHVIGRDLEVCKVFCEPVKFGGVALAPSLGDTSGRNKYILPRQAFHMSDDEIKPFVERCRVREDVVRFVRPGGVGVELGVAEGEFSERVLRMQHLGYLYGVDMYAGDRGHNNQQYARSLRRLEQYRTSHSLIKMTFDEALLVFKDESVDFVYVDGYAHTGEDDGRHFDTWWEKLAIGGILAGDDYSDAWPRVIKSVNAFIERRGLYMHLINCIELDSTWSRSPTWFAVKRSR